jgi:uncharacterized protein (DUF433 family)
MAPLTPRLDRFIETTPGVCGGKPRITGHRIRVVDIAIWNEKLGLRTDDIASKYNLSLAEVHAALAYFFGHQEELEADLRADEAFVAELKKGFPSLWLGAVHE